MVAGKRMPGSRGADPLSVATRRRLLAGMLARADAGDVEAAEALVRLSIAQEAARAGTGQVPAEAA